MPVVGPGAWVSLGICVSVCVCVCERERVLYVGILRLSVFDMWLGNRRRVRVCVSAFPVCGW